MGTIIIKITISTIIYLITYLIVVKSSQQLFHLFHRQLLIEVTL